MASPCRWLGVALVAWLVACSDGSGNPQVKHSTDAGASAKRADGGTAQCAPGSIDAGGRCVVDPLRRYEPKKRVDVDNVVSYTSGAPELPLPDPPKSGFRLIVPPRQLAAGQEAEGCHAWAYPKLTNKNVYAARMYTSGGLHHSNMYGVPLSSAGPSNYPACASGQDSVAAQVPNFLAGNIMDVLFANSTQVEGGEQIVFMPGMAFKLKTDGREITTSIHWLNTSNKSITSEIVYDFFTMPDDQVKTEIVPFVFENQGFEVAPRTRGDITTTCDIAGKGNIVTIMPHTHKRASAFDVVLLRADGSEKSILHDGAFNTDSDITVFDQPISLDGFSRIRHTCTVNNDLSRPIVWGIGDNEMCTLFGYLYPPSAQVLGLVSARDPSAPNVEPPCLVLDLGQYRK